MPFVAIPDLEPRSCSTSVRDHWLFVATRSRLLAIDVIESRIVWERSRPTLSSACYQVPRRLRSHGARLATLMTDVVWLTDSEEGVAVSCFRRDDGALRWEQRVATPAELPWTEPAPVCRGAWTEVLDAFLARPTQAGPVLVIGRTSRRSEHGVGGQRFPAPPLHAQLEILALDDDVGIQRWTAALPDLRVPIGEQDRFDLLVRNGQEIIAIDELTGAVQRVARTPKPCCWPRRVGDRLLSAWRTARGVGLISVPFDATDSTSESFVDRPNPKEVKVHEAGTRAILETSGSTFCLIQADLSAGPQIRTKGYLYGAASPSGGLVVVATSGHGGGVYAIDSSTGHQVAAHMLPQGAWHVSAIAETGQAMLVCGPGVATIDGRTGALVITNLPCAAAIAGSFRNKAAVLTGPPANSGVHILDL